MSEDEASKSLDRIVTKASLAAKELIAGMSTWERAVERAVGRVTETKKVHVVYYEKGEDGKNKVVVVEHKGQSIPSIRRVWVFPEAKGNPRVVYE